MGMAPMTMAPLAAWLVSHHDWRTSMQIVALIVASIMIPVSLLVRRAPALASGPSAPSGDSAQADMTLAQALRSPQFIILLLTNFFCCATHSGPIIHTVSYAISCGIPLVAAVTIYSLEGFAGLGGRIAFGLLGDRFGAKRLGQDGPHDRFDTGKFPPAQYRMVDCSGFRDYAFDFASSHQYYRRSPGVRADIASAMTGPIV